MEHMKWDDSCAIYQTLDIMGKKWSLFIIFLIWNKFTSYNTILNKISWLNSKILSERLKNLEDQWFVERKIVSERPVKIEYHLTEKWVQLEKIIDQIKEISGKNGEKFDDSCRMFDIKK